MKNLKLFLMAIASIALISLNSCGNENDPEGPGSGSSTEDKAAFVLKHEGKVLKNGDVIVITEEKYGEMIAHMTMTNNTKRPMPIIMHEVRNFDENVKGSAFCTTACIEGEAGTEQIWNIPDLTPNVDSRADYHLRLLEGKTTTNSSAELTFVADTEEIKITVKFELN